MIDTTLAQYTELESLWPEIRNRTIAIPIDDQSVPDMPIRDSFFTEEVAQIIKERLLVIAIYEATQQLWRYERYDEGGMEFKPGMFVAPCYPKLLFVRPYSKKIFRVVDFPADARFRVLQVGRVKVDEQYNDQYAVRTDQTGPYSILPVDWGVFQIVP